MGLLHNVYAAVISTPNPRPMLIAGASGFEGSHIGRLLLERGRTVRVMLRKSSNGAAVAGLPVQIVQGDVLDPVSLRAAMRGCATINYSVLEPRFWLTNQTPILRNNLQGLVNAMQAVLTTEIERFMFISWMGTLGLNSNGPVTEDIAFN
jgi:dihydroflavonol-4-reductase